MNDFQGNSGQFEKINAQFQMSQKLEKINQTRGVTFYRRYKGEGGGGMGDSNSSATTLLINNCVGKL